jgi:hypothetical protein
MRLFQTVDLDRAMQPSVRGKCRLGPADLPLYASPTHMATRTIGGRPCAYHDIRCNTQCVSRTRKDADGKKSHVESVMKCANHDCNRGLGLVSYRRGWFHTRRYCSRPCRDAFVVEQPNRSQQDRSVTTCFEWLFLQKPQPKLMPAVVRKGRR